MAVKTECPSCKVRGKEHITATSSEQKAPGGLPRFEIVMCDECGHVYTVYPNYMIPGSV